MAVIQTSSIECRCPGYTNTKTDCPPLALTTIPEGCSFFTQDFIIPVVNYFTFKMPITCPTSCSILKYGLFLNWLT